MEGQTLLLLLLLTLPLLPHPEVSRPLTFHPRDSGSVDKDVTTLITIMKYRRFVRGFTYPTFR